MTTVRKFTFDVSFDDLAPDSDSADRAAQPAPEPEPEPADAPESEGDAEDDTPQPAYTEEDIELAREEGYVAGHTAALDEVAVKNEQALIEAVQRCAAGLEALAPAIERGTEEVSELAAHVAVDVCRKLLPHCAEDYAAGEIIALVRALLPNLVGQPRLLVKVAPALVEPVRRTLVDLPAHTGFEGRILVVEDPALNGSDVRVEWPDGGAERNTTRLWDEIDALIERNIPRFARGEAVEVPEAERANEDAAEDAAVPEDVWPEVDPAAYWVPPAVPTAGGAPEGPARTEDPERAADDEDPATAKPAPQATDGSWPADAETTAAAAEDVAPQTAPGHPQPPFGVDTDAGTDHTEACEGTETAPPEETTREEAAVPVGGEEHEDDAARAT